MNRGMSELDPRWDAAKLEQSALRNLQVTARQAHTAAMVACVNAATNEEAAMFLSMLGLTTVAGGVHVSA